MPCTDEQCPPLCVYEGQGYELMEEVYRTECQVCSCAMNGSVECVDDLSKNGKTDFNVQKQYLKDQLCFVLFLFFSFNLLGAWDGGVLIDER